MSLYNYQERVKQLLREGRSIILQAPTGAGKTRAALAPFIEPFWNEAATFPKQCLYSVPMRVLVNQFFEEYDKTAATYRRVHRRDIDIKRQTGEYKEDPELRGDLTFATIDQTLSSWLQHPYGLSGRMGNLNAGALIGRYLIFDEFHLFDPDSTLPTTLHMLNMLKDVSPFMLMTATFSADMLQNLAKQLNAVPILLTPEDLTDIAAQDKERHYHVADEMLVAEGAANVTRILSTHADLPTNWRRSLVVCNQVERAQQVYAALREQAPAGTTIKLLHSRFLPADRNKIESEVRREFGKNRDEWQHDSYILIGTQVVEVGLDMSAAALHTELAPASSVLQRAGRCARYEGEVGHVFVYPTENNAPYHKTEASAQCERTLAWVQENQGRHLSFADEQTWVNHVHAPTDKRILDGIRATGLSHREQIQRLWKGDGTRAEAAALVRSIESVSVLVHDDTEQLREEPFAFQSFSLHPGTVAKQFKLWEEANDALDEDYDEGKVDWLIKKIVEDESENEKQGNRPIRYDFKPIKIAKEIWHPLLVVHSDLVSYSAETGFSLSAGGDTFRSPKRAKDNKSREIYSYKLESYGEHIRLVHEAFLQERNSFAAAAQRIEMAFGWRVGVLAEIAEWVMLLHDVGKLSVGWQKWARLYQKEIELPMDAGFFAAHTDYDPFNERHREMNKKLRGKRPTHAVESAVAAMPILHREIAARVGNDAKTAQAIFNAALTAICRHHAPFTSQSAAYQLESNATAAVLKTLPTAAPITLTQALNKPLTDPQMQKQILIDVTKAQHVLPYFLFARALRSADQLGTKNGSL